MAHITADRVRDTTTTTGTGALTVSGSAPNGYKTFSDVLSTSDTFYYAIQHQAASEWEVGLGTYSSANTITRTTVYSSSNSGSAVNFSAGTKDIFITLAASRTVQKDASGNISGLVIGTNVQAYDADLAAIAALAGTTGLLVKTAANTWSLDTSTYQSQITTSGLLKGAGSGSISSATAGADYLSPPSGTAILKANSGGALANATAGTDYVAPGTATTFTAAQTFSGSSSSIAAILANAAEPVTVSATAATGTINYDVTTQSVIYYTSSASANWTVNLRASSGTSLNTAMSVGQAITVAFLVTQGGTAYYNSAVQVDGSSVTPKWQSGTAPTSGNASSIDVYTYTIVKTASATFTVFASQTKFA